MLYVILVFAPLLGAIIAGFFGRMIGDRASQYVTCGLMGVSAICSIFAITSTIGAEPFRVPLFTWMNVSTFEVDWALRIDALSGVMMFVVSFISCFIHIYSIGYMSHDKSIPRFMSYLSLFTFAMLMLVTSDNLIQLFFGWEGVGVASYLLIGFWYTKPSACAAAIKAFLVNRVGDVGLMLGIATCYLLFDSVQYDVIFADAAGMADADHRGVRRRVPCAHRRRDPALHRCHGQVGAARPAHLAAGRHGRPDPGLGADPRRHHGHRRRLPRRPLLAGLRARADRTGAGHLHRRLDRHLRRDHRAAPSSTSSG